MLQDGILLADGSVADNLQIQHGTTLPVTGNNVGELFYKTGSASGLYVYDGSTWVQQNAGSGGSSSFTVTGDVTGTLDGGTDVLTLSTISGVAGAWGASSETLQVTVDSKGRITSIGQPAIFINESQINDNNLLSRNAGDETITGAWTFSNPVTGATPTASTHLSTKGYVDARDAKDACYVATTTNITLSGLQTIDGYALNAGDRVLVKDQSTPTQNGLYNAASGAWTRTSDFASGTVSSGAQVTVTAGTTNARTFWTLQTVNPITVGTTSLVFGQISAPSTSTYTITGDVTGTIDGGTDVLTLATVNTNPGSYGSSSSIPNITVDGKGRVTAVAMQGLTVTEAGITPGSILARLADNQTITGNWTHSGTLTIAEPTLSGHATTKNYVDTAIAGLSWKNTARVATTANITLSGAQTIDGVSVVAGNRVLVKNQTTGSQNGIYVVASGAWTRSTDMDGSPDVGEVNGAAVYVTDGTANADTSWTQTATITTVGTDTMTFVQFGGGGTVNASSLTGTTLASGVTASSLTSVGTITTGTWSGAFGAVSGANLTSLNASNLGSGTVPTARLGSGTANSTTYLRGDNTWAALSSSLTSTQIGFGSASNVLTGDPALTYSVHTDAAPNYWHAQVLSLNGAAAYDQSFYLGNDLGGNTGNYNRVGLTFHGSASGSAYASTGDTTLNFAGTFRISASGGGSGGQPLPIVTVNSATQTLTVNNLAGAGAAITALNASNLSTGTVPVARLGSSGTASSTTFLRGDNTWATPVATADAGTLTGSTLASGVTASSLTSVGTITTGTWSGSFGAVSGANLTTLNASNLASGTVAPARLGSGTTNSTTYLRGDNTWQTITSGASLSTANTWTALQTFNGPGAGTFAVGFGAAYTEKQNAPTLAATFPIDCSLGNNFTVALGATAITSIAFTNVPTTGTNYSVTLYVTQPATGSVGTMSLSSATYTPTTSSPQAATIKWAGGTAPTVTATLGKIDIFTFVTYDGGNTWLGFIAGQNY